MPSQELVQKLASKGVEKPRVVIEEAERAGLGLANALAMLEKETGIPQRNIFGCDHGPGVAFCHENVTEAKVKQLIASGRANGVGWTQLTFPPFVHEAERLGGAHKPRIQMRVGFKVLADNIRRLGQQDGFRAYNGSGPAAEQYGREAVALARKWSKVVN